eukprot:11582799-Alexandrium_andersonii.AAC.1
MCCPCSLGLAGSGHVLRVRAGTSLGRGQLGLPLRAYFPEARCHGADGAAMHCIPGCARALRAAATGGATD